MQKVDVTKGVLYCYKAPQQQKQENNINSIQPQHCIHIANIKMYMGALMSE